MPASTGCFSTGEAAHDIGVPIELVRRTVDRLKLGVRVGRNRILFAEDIEKLVLVFRGMGRLSDSDPVRPSETAGDGGSWK